MKTNIYRSFSDSQAEGKKSFAVLIDPDKIDGQAACMQLVTMGMANQVNYFLVGGSLITGNNFGQVVRLIKDHTDIPVVIFPGSSMHIEPDADAILFLSLISGRNPDLLIGQHVVAAPVLKRSNLEVLPTGYMLVDSGNPTTVSYMSNTMPIPGDKPSVAACTAVAGEMLGLKLIYMDAGSGAEQPVSGKMISMVRKSVNIPLIVGGGINNAHKAARAYEAGADTIVIGNGIEKNPNLLVEVAELTNRYNQQMKV
ncbi:phosphoglycerol geranylgeranyltransferase [Catalinimonas niigatensis]|uniref:geranylgeranylglyceryl/heptaprenylglyceryl phosphate synthase n=1 Tax=Catalinimonas niigatensis TaxID=1397264 RepID=UPI0026658285|nr:geranylgeranylglyceryl/heptaprenylglyceryl phosphate synthase [Catalinimonas niigatensis]WPP49431.1 geranylgeranylglyceryl/heptaprenylglyceryl phosphate synthase [Catalinimonas niigatensis]